MNQHRNTTHRVLAAGTALAACLTITACKEGIPQEQYDEVTRQVERLKKDIDGLKEDRATDKERFAKQVEEAEAATTEIEAQVKTLEAELEAARKQSEELLNEFEEYKKEYRLSIRQRAKGMEFPQIATLKGVVFKDITLSKLDPVEIRFIHAEGIGSLPLSELKAEYADRFGFNEAEALAFIESKEREGEGGSDEVAYEQDRESKVDYNRERQKLAEQRQIQEDLVAQLGREMQTIRQNISTLNDQISMIRRKGKGAFVKDSSKDPKQEIRFLQERVVGFKERLSSLQRQYLEAKRGA